MQRFDVVIIGLIIVGVAWYIWWHLKHRLRPNG